MTELKQMPTSREMGDLRVRPEDQVVLLMVALLIGLVYISFVTYGWGFAWPGWLFFFLTFIAFVLAAFTRFLLGILTFISSRSYWARQMVKTLEGLPEKNVGSFVAAFRRIFTVDYSKNRFINLQRWVVVLFSAYLMFCLGWVTVPTGGPVVSPFTQLIFGCVLLAPSISRNRLSFVLLAIWAVVVYVFFATDYFHIPWVFDWLSVHNSPSGVKNLNNWGAGWIYEVIPYEVPIEGTSEFTPPIAILSVVTTALIVFIATVVAGWAYLPFGDASKSWYVESVDGSNVNLEVHVREGLIPSSPVKNAYVFLRAEKPLKVETTDLIERSDKHGIARFNFQTKSGDENSYTVLVEGEPTEKSDSRYLAGWG